MPGRSIMDVIFASRLLCRCSLISKNEYHVKYCDGPLIRKVCMRSTYNGFVPCIANIVPKLRFDEAVGLHRGSALSLFLFLLLRDAVTVDI